MAEYKVIFQPSGRRGTIQEGKTLLQAAQELGVGIEAACGGGKVCGKCKVIIEEEAFEKQNIYSSHGNVSLMTKEEARLLSEEEIKKGYRLACHTHIVGDVLVTVPEESRSAKQVVLETGKERKYKINPAVKNYELQLEVATLEDYRDDKTRLIEALQEKYHFTHPLTIDYTVLTNLSEVIRKGNWKVTATVWQDREIIKVRSGYEANSYGVAIDIGTTTLAAYLCNLYTGAVLEKASKMNPQIAYGEDILARITFANTNEEGLKKLNEAIIDAINDLIGEMTKKAGINMQDVDEVVLVYNTAMHHIALNIDPRYIGQSPFIPAIKDAIDIKARDMKIKINPAGNIHSLPIEAGFVGADNVSVLIAEEPYKAEEIRLIIDIGTNGEIDLGNKERLLCTSCATGPALEGAQIKHGMRAAPGAIEKVSIDAQTFEPRYKVIGKDEWYPENKKLGAQGICGSGIIDVIAEMFKAGIILKTGRINNKLDTKRVRTSEEGRLEYVLAFANETSIGKDIVINQADIRAVQLAKAAIYVGAKFLMNKYGVQKVDRVTLAGAFGSYINKESAMAIGLFPDCELEKVEAVGNAAGDGAKMALLDKEKRIEASKIASQVEFIETAVEKDFQQQFLDAIAFPHAKDKFLHIS